MYTPEDIQRCFDASTLKYVANKNRGGSSGQKGMRYEDYFAVYKLALLAHSILEAGLHIHFSSQLLAFVDDLIIDILDEPLQHYQLKNSPTVSWLGDTHPIQIDFANQHHLNLSIYSRESQIFLVVSNQACSMRLENTIPTSIEHFSRVSYFPYASDVMAVVEKMLMQMVYNLEPHLTVSRPRHFADFRSVLKTEDPPPSRNWRACYDAPIFQSDK